MTAELTRFLAAYDAMVGRWPGPVDRLDLRSGYGTTRVIAYGPADGKPLVLLHGGGTTAAVLYGLAAEFPRARVVTGGRPRAGQLREVTTPTLVLLAGDSRAHRVQRVAAAARRDLPHVETAVLPGVSHHGMPALQAAAIDGMILSFLDKP